MNDAADWWSIWKKMLIDKGENEYWPFSSELKNIKVQYWDNAREQISFFTEYVPYVLARYEFFPGRIKFMWIL